MGNCIMPKSSGCFPWTDQAIHVQKGGAVALPPSSKGECANGEQQGMRDPPSPPSLLQSKGSGCVGGPGILLSVHISDVTLSSFLRLMNRPCYVIKNSTTQYPECEPLKWDLSQVQGWLPTTLAECHQVTDLLL